jgi:hypothetical protein
MRRGYPAPGRGFLGPGGSGFSPVRFQIGPPSCLFTRGAEPFLTSPSGSPRGGGEVRNEEAPRNEPVRAGRRGTETETQRAAPAHTGLRCAGTVRGLFGRCRSRKSYRPPHRARARITAGMSSGRARNRATRPRISSGTMSTTGVST